MITALRFEWVRLRTLRSTYWLIGLALLLSAGVAFLVAFASRNDVDPLNNAAIGSIITGGGLYTAIPFPAVMMAIVGIFATGHEYRHGTIQPTLTAIPQRSRLLLAKLTIVGITALVVCALSILLNLALGMIYWEELPDLGASPINEMIIGYFALVLCWAVLGLALALLFRGIPSAITVILVFPLVIEGLISGLSFVPALDWLTPVVKFLPFTAGGQLITFEGIAEGDVARFDLLERWASGGLFAGYILVILLIAWGLFKKRDA